MLPISKRRTIRVPHSLATVAAVLALVTAVGWEATVQNEPETPAHATARDQVESTGQRDRETEDNRPPARRVSATDNNPGALSRLLPLVLPGTSGI